ncbi:ovarian cancer G-protein coupled receptor 1-like [Polyodon spathula]|nr:ovarian cancer G-protein coupled receptor 1-like [Polyodon spathula]
MQFCNMSNESNRNCDIDHNIHQYLFSGVYIIVLAVGLPANIFSLHHGWQQWKNKNELGIYLINLTGSDLLYLASLPLWLQYIFLGDNWKHQEWLCNVCGFLLYENIYISIGFMCCISVDRYLAVVYPFRFHCLRSTRAAVLVSVFIWLKEIGVSISLVVHKELSQDQNNHSICFEHYPMRDWERKVNYYRFFIGYLFPLCILTISYFRVLRAVNKSTGTVTSQKVRIKSLVSGTILIFLLCFCPYHFFLLVRIILEQECSFVKKIFNFYHVSILLTSFNCIADPVLYCFASENNQKKVLRMKNYCMQLLGCKKAENTDLTENDTPDQNGSVLAVKAAAWGGSADRIFSFKSAGQNRDKLLVEKSII